MAIPPKIRTVLLRSARLMSEMINEVLEAYQLNYSLWQVIYLIHEHQCITSIDLSKILKVSKPSIAKRIQVILQLNIIEPVKSLDKREKKLQLTAHGYSVFSDCSKMIDVAEQDLLSNFQIKDLQQTFETLEQILQKLENNKHGESK